MVLVVVVVVVLKIAINGFQLTVMSRNYFYEVTSQVSI